MSLNEFLRLIDYYNLLRVPFRLQLLESDKGKKFWVFRAWGRIGTEIGNNKIEKFHDLPEALKNFHDIYLEKTGNRWENRGRFQKHPYKFVPIDVDYGEVGIICLSQYSKYLSYRKLPTVCLWIPRTPCFRYPSRN